MIMGIQRLPRYELLLTDLLKHTDVGSSDHSVLERSIAAIRAAIVFVNEQKREHESTSRVLQLQEKTKGKSEQLYRPGRLLLREGLLKQIKIEGGKKFDDSKWKEVYVFLFNDIMVCSKQTLSKKTSASPTSSSKMKVRTDQRFASLKYLHKTTIDLSAVSLADLSSQTIPGGDYCFGLVSKSSVATLAFKADTVAQKKEWLLALQGLQFL